MIGIKSALNIVLDIARQHVNNEIEEGVPIEDYSVELEAIEVIEQQLENIHEHI